MRKLFFVLCGGFLIAAVFVQFRHNLISESYKNRKIHEFEQKNLKLLANQWPLSLSDPRGITGKELAAIGQQQLINLKAKERGEPTAETIQYDQWLEKLKTDNFPFSVLLYGTSLFLLLCGLLTKEESAVATGDCGGVIIND